MYRIFLPKATCGVGGSRRGGGAGGRRLVAGLRHSEAPIHIYIYIYIYIYTSRQGTMLHNRNLKDESPLENATEHNPLDDSSEHPLDK